MDRRDFCRFAAVCTLTACAGALGGCARMLEWSASDEARPARRVEPAEAPSAPAAPSSPSTPGAAPPVPDIAVFTGDDPQANVRAAIGELGGMERFVRRGAKVVVKPNMLTARAPEYAVTTNPAVVAAIVRMALEAGADDVVVLDRPTAEPRNVYEVSGIAKAVREAGGRMKLLTDRDYDRFEIPKGRILTAWPMVTDVFDADTFITVPIAKTHGSTRLTLSMKNQMGILGGVRGLIHQDLHQKLVDLATVARPHLVVLDAYRMLMANGPSGGTLADVKTAKTVVAGTSTVSVDAFGTTLFGMEPDDVEHIRLAGEQGVGVTDLGRLRVTKGAT